ncbi:hypothetical protein QWZ10_09250 [Paracoccus cavernae]|uniref:Uncharacterized protein n=1 Tax=Paracoccus cavernae TaxID=1571207 RepID=A0ABT8D620_9RHOB|nr:hypothetical protein [Paracoccus cavernae]
MTLDPRLDTAPLEALREEALTVADEVDGISMLDVKREADFKLAQAINAVKVLRKLSA